MRTFVLTLAAAVLLSGCATAATSPAGAQGRGRQVVRVANDFPGADLGAKINAADASLGTTQGEIQVRGGGAISTQVVLGPGHTLRFAAGTYTLETGLLWEGAFLLKSGTKVVGAGWETVIVEPSKVGWIVFQAFNDARVQPSHTGTDSDIHVSDLQIKGANPAVEGGARQTIGLGNCHSCGVENVWFNGTGVIGVQAGGSPLTGNFAEDVTFRKNQFTRVASQAVAVVNGRKVVIDSNKFNDSGRCCLQGMTPIDLEPNDPRDIIRDIEITNNVIDSRHSNFIHGNGILVQNGVHTQGYGPVLVQNNTVIGGELVPNTSGFVSVGIYITAFTENVRVINNTVKRVGASGIRLENTSRNYVSGNKLISTGTGGIISFEITNTTDSQIFDNVVAIDPNSPLGTEIIQEAGTAARNSYRGNSSSKGALVANTISGRP